MSRVHLQTVAAQLGVVSITPVWKQVFAAAAQWHCWAWLLHWMAASPGSPSLQQKEDRWCLA